MFTNSGSPEPATQHHVHIDDPGKLVHRDAGRRYLRCHGHRDWSTGWHKTKCWVQARWCWWRRCSNMRGKLGGEHAYCCIQGELVSTLAFAGLPGRRERPQALGSISFVVVTQIVRSNFCGNHCTDVGRRAVVSSFRTLPGTSMPVRAVRVRANSVCDSSESCQTSTSSQTLFLFPV